MTTTAPDPPATLRNIDRMPCPSSRTRLVALALGLVLLTACGSSRGADRAAAAGPDELPARLDNGTSPPRSRDGELHESPTRACGDSRHDSDRSLVVRVLPDGPRAPDGRLAFRSGVCVYLPPGYGSGTAHYPVVYLLHGAGENAADPVMHGLRRLMDERISQDPGAAAIVVMPDGDDAQWIDSIDGRIRNETYVTGYLVPYVDHHFRTIATRTGRGITGVSNGGYGAFLFAAKHPDVFGAAGGMSSNIDWFGAPSLGGPDGEPTGGLGSPTGEYYAENRPVNLAPRLADTDLVLDMAVRCTSTDPADRCGTQAIDTRFLAANRAFVAVVRQVPGRTGALEYGEHDGAHRWATWMRWLRDRQLPFFAENLAEPR